MITDRRGTRVEREAMCSLLYLMLFYYLNIGQGPSQFTLIVNKYLCPVQLWISDHLSLLLCWG